jgi:hypothetical protein
MREEMLASEKPESVVAIGLSADGVGVIRTILGALPAGLDAPIVIVMHRGSQQVPRLAQVIAKHCALPVKEAAPMDVLTPGHVPGLVEHARATFRFVSMHYSMFSFACVSPDGGIVSFRSGRRARLPQRRPAQASAPRMEGRLVTRAPRARVFRPAGPLFGSHYVRIGPCAENDHVNP